MNIVVPRIFINQKEKEIWPRSLTIVTVHLCVQKKKNLVGKIQPTVFFNTLGKGKKENCVLKAWW